MELTDPTNFLTKYRPESFQEIIGHADVVRQLSEILHQENQPHSFLLTGPSGVGKTSIARIIGKELNAFIDEIDVANAPGAEEMRDLMDRVTLFPLGKQHRRLVIVDECHTTSAKGWSAVLKTIEEPPPHLYFAFCTTDVHRVPRTIVTRSVHFDLKPISVPDLMELVEIVAAQEGWTLKDRIGRAIAIASQGSPRHSLALLSRYHGAEDPEQIDRTTITTASESGIIRLMRLLIDKERTPTWKSVQAILEETPDNEIESWIYPAQEYLCSVMGSEKDLRTKEQCTELLSVMMVPVSEDIRMKTRLFRFLGRVVNA